MKDDRYYDIWIKLDAGKPSEWAKFALLGM